MFLKIGMKTINAMKYFKIILFLCICNPLYSQNISELDSLTTQLNIAKNNQNIDDELKFSFKIFRLNIDKLDYNQAYIIGVKLEQLITIHKDNETAISITPHLYSKMGWLCHAQVQYQESIVYYRKAIRYAEEQKLNDNIYGWKGSIAFNLYLLGESEQAFQMMTELMQEAEVSTKPNLIANAHYNLYTILVESKPKKALEHAKQSLNTTNIGDVGHRYINIGTCYHGMKQLDSALKYTLKGKVIAENNSFLQQQSNAHIQLRNIYLELKNYERAMFHTIKFEELSAKSGSFKSAMEFAMINKNILKEKAELQKTISEKKFYNQRIIIWLIVSVSLILIGSLFYISNRLKLIHKQNKIIEQEKERAESSEKHKEQFLANMSHEIRTPMHAISGMTNTLLRNSHPKEQDPYLEAMKTSSENLLGLLNDILDLSKIESGKLEINYEAINPQEIVSKVIQILKFRATDKGLELNSEISTDCPQQIIGDASRLTQILINLVGNAIKFTQKGSIIIKLNYGNDLLRIAIIDTGIGIESEKLEVIFNNFEQGERSRSQIYGGTGLGLSISKRLVELQQGRIWAESELGKGSTFFIELPIKRGVSTKVNTPISQKIDISSMSKILNGLKILIVDDDEFNIMVVKDDLNYYVEHLTFLIAENGQEAINLFKNQTFDVILMDMHMPIMNGCDATKIIRDIEENNTLNRTPIIAMTANIITSELNKCMKSGMDDYITKPYQPEKLIEVIHNILKPDN